MFTQTPSHVDGTVVSLVGTVVLEKCSQSVEPIVKQSNSGPHTTADLRDRTMEDIPLVPFIVLILALI